MELSGRWWLLGSGTWRKVVVGAGLSVDRDGRKVAGGWARMGKGEQRAGNCSEGR